jgi:hypothetical protein
MHRWSSWLRLLDPRRPGHRCSRPSVLGPAPRPRTPSGHCRGRSGRRCRGGPGRSRPRPRGLPHHMQRTSSGPANPVTYPYQCQPSRPHTTRFHQLMASEAYCVDASITIAGFRVADAFPACRSDRSSWLAVLAGRGRCRPPQARPQLLGHHLDHGAGAAVLGRPGPLVQPAHDHWSRPSTIRLPPLTTNPTSSGPPEATRPVSAQSAMASQEVIC